MKKATLLSSIVLGASILWSIAAPLYGHGLTDEEMRLTRELEETRNTLDHKEWTWTNREEKKGLEDKAALLARVQTSIDQYRQRICDRRKAAAALATPAPDGTSKIPMVLELTGEEVKLIWDHEELKNKLEKTTWQWGDRDKKTELEKRLEGQEKTLQEFEDRRVRSPAVPGPK